MKNYPSLGDLFSNSSIQNSIAVIPFLFTVISKFFSLRNIMNIQYNSNQSIKMNSENHSAQTYQPIYNYEVKFRNHEDMYTQSDFRKRI